MSMFNGIIEEIPGISVDRFNENNSSSSAFFLSHCHADHMQGLNAQFFQYLHDKGRYLYCTPISETILANKYCLNDHLRKTIQMIDGCASIIISYCRGSEMLYLTVTSIPAGHCPGSIMFLFENSTHNILYTGDSRIDASDYARFKPLHNIVNGKMIPKKFDAIYLDTTFFHSDFSYFPSRQNTLCEIHKVVHDWISRNVKNIVILECSGNYGSEYLFIQLSKALGIRVHVKDEIFKSYTFIPELTNCITDDPYASQVHACMNKNFRNDLKCRFGVESESIITIVPSAMRWKSIKSPKHISEWDKDGKRFYVCYSCHSSRDELEAFIEYFRPTKIYPCVCPKRMSLDQLQIQLDKVLMRSKTSSCNHYNVVLSRHMSYSQIKLKTINMSDDDDD